MNELIVQTKHNDQLNNKAFANLNPASQCGLSSACMVMSKFIPDAESDDFLAKFLYGFDKEYLDDKSKTKPRKSAVLTNYPPEINKHLVLHKVNKQARVKPHSATEVDIKHALSIGSPVMVATLLTPHGHYITIIGYNDEKNCWIVNDPYGVFSFENGRYIKVGNNSGASLYYPYGGLNKAMEKSSRLVTNNKSGGSRILWIE